MRLSINNGSSKTLPGSPGGTDCPYLGQGSAVQVLEDAAEGGGAGRGPGPAPLRVRRQRPVLPEHPVPLAHRLPGIAAASRRQLRRAWGWSTGGHAPCGNTATQSVHTALGNKHTWVGTARPAPAWGCTRVQAGQDRPVLPAHAPTGSRCAGAGLEPAPSLSAHTPPAHSPRPDAIFAGPTNRALARGGGKDGRAAAPRRPAAHLLRPIAEAKR